MEVVELDLQERTNYPIALNVDDLAGLSRHGATRQPAEPQRVCGYMRTVLENLVEALESVPDTAVRAVDVLPEDERRQLLEAWNDTAEAYDQDVKHFHQRFARQAQRVVDAVAVVSGAESLSYAELDGRSNQLSHYLKAHGVGPNVLVGICMERCRTCWSACSASSRPAGRTCRWILSLPQRTAGDDGRRQRRPGNPATRRSPSPCTLPSQRPSCPHRHGLADHSPGVPPQRRLSARAGGFRLCHLHLRLDRQAEERADSAARLDQSAAVVWPPGQLR